MRRNSGQACGLRYAHQQLVTEAPELAERFPMHVVTAWLGNSPDVARKHYLQTTEEHFDRATGEKAQQDARDGLPSFPGGRGDHLGPEKQFIPIEAAGNASGTPRC